MSLSSCFGSRKRDGDREPLLPQYENDETKLQHELHKKLHSYQQVRALTKGFMPSNEQIIINIRTILAADILNPENTDLSDSGRLLVKYTKRWLQQFMDLMAHKNGEDQIQDLLWYLSKSRIDIDVEDLARRAKNSKAKADTAAAYQSLRTVGSLLLTNSDFRVFLSDLTIVGKEVFKDSAFTLSKVAESAGKAIEPSSEEQQAVAKPGADANQPAPTAKDLEHEIEDVTKVVANGTAQVTKTAVRSAEEKLAGDEGQTLINRLQEAVLKLRKRNDYSDSVSTLAKLIQRYAMVYSRAAEEIVEIAQDDVQENPETDRALRNFWSFVKSFGDLKQWEKCEELVKKVMSHKQNDPEFEDLMQDIGNSLQKLLTDPDFFQNAQEKFQELREKGKKVGTESSLRDDIDALLGQVQTTLMSVLEDKDIHNMIKTTTSLATILSPTNALANPELLQDSINVFVPLLISAVQYVPIPRLEVSTPDVDLLLENLIIEPGHTVNHTSFLPYRLKVETYNDFELKKARFRTAAKSTNLMTIKIDGLSARADEVGFWLRTHSGILRMVDEGITSFALDDRGIDIHIDVEICKERLEQILTLKAVRVHIHKLNYSLRKSRFSWVAWLIKPLLRPILRKTMEKQLATALTDFFHTANRELLFARERLRATRISNPDDLMTFFKAVAARLTPEDDPDLYSRVGVTQPGEGVFKNKYAPGSVVKLWNEEAAQAGERVEEFSADGWRNDIFDAHARALA
jgi:hypothetical protein